jgi:hypothetical protein
MELRWLRDGGSIFLRSRNLRQPPEYSVSCYSWFFRSWTPRIAAAHLCFFYLSFWLFFSTAVPRVTRYCRAQCSRAPLATLRLCETAQSSTFMAFILPPEMFLESFGTVVYTADSGIPPIPIPEVYFSRSAVFRLNSVTSGWMLLFTTQAVCVWGSEWLMPQVALCTPGLVRTSAETILYVQR